MLSERSQAEPRLPTTRVGDRPIISIKYMADSSSALAQRNAAHAAIVRSWLEESLNFSALEMAIAQQEAIVALCNEFSAEFSAFAAIDELIATSNNNCEPPSKSKRQRLECVKGAETKWLAIDVEGATVNVVATWGTRNMLCIEYSAANLGCC